ncbi:flagellar biosynthesis protein FliQ [Zhengella mangrovi]|uniref:Flagellar biosynthesis protein FliQ n=1 Tax=Zhengella mangrovi TaxID=1982044 RepID=A0A2G1QMN5_9HYPH|nr:flagellar biosynthetic protein FliQ [Zhengella mangrovi]PHP66488.1 flagellar biosynthesis protein FliQ [Zhengella mangrovi]
MAAATLTSALYQFLYYSAIFVVPPLIVATVIAFIVGLFQAVTQIQEQTLPQTIKIFAIGLVLIMFGGSLAAPLFGASQQVFNDFYRYGAH